MKVKQKLNRHSFTVLCAIYFLAFALIILICYVALQGYIAQKLNHAFPTIEELFDYEDALTAERYEDIALTDRNNCRYIVFGADGEVIFASDERIKEQVNAKALPFIRDYDEKYTYSVMKQMTQQGEPVYKIQKYHYDYESGFSELVAYGVVDDDLNVLEGTLFADQDKLTDREFDFLKGHYSQDDYVVKYEYETDAGEPRVLVFVAERVNPITYDKLLHSIRYLRLSIVPILVVVTIAATVLFAKIIKRNIASLNGVIAKYRHPDDFQANRERIPVEFDKVLDTVDVLMSRIEASEQERKRIVADLSHDLKTPLSVISGCSKAFSEGLVPRDEQDRYMRIIYEKSTLASVLIDDLFDYAKLRHPDFKANFETVDFCEYTREFFAGKYTDIENSGFTLQVSIPEKAVPVQIDQRLFSRVFENIVNNSLRYNKTGTTLYVELTARADEVHLSIADNGIGIRDDLVQSIFEPFVTSDHARGSESGTGLGLSIAKRVTELHGGQIQIKTFTAGYSTQILLTLPISA